LSPTNCFVILFYWEWWLLDPWLPGFCGSR
jgi:hypothetical protein